MGFFSNLLLWGFGGSVLLTLFDPIRDFGQGERVFLFMSAVADQALQNYTKGQSIGFHVKNYVKVEMSPSLGGKNCSLTRNVFFPISRLLMSEKIHVAYAQERHASDFYLYILKTWSGLELSRLFSINAVSLLSQASKVQAEEWRLGSLPHLCFTVPKRMWEWTLPTKLTLGFCLWFEKVSDNAKWSQMLCL